MSPDLDDERAPARRSRRAAVWLTTLSTVLAVATGMFTLRDQIFPAEGADAEASVSLFQQGVGDTCEELNAADRKRSEDVRRLAARLPRARTTLAQRNALLDSTNRVVARSEHALASFRGLDTPRSLAARARRTGMAWDRAVASMRAYSRALDGVQDRQDLLATIRTLPAMRVSLARDIVTRGSGLTRLAGGRCRLDPPIATPVITLPALRTRSRRRPGPGSGSGTALSDQGASNTGSGSDEPGADVGPDVSPDASPPAASDSASPGSETTDGGQPVTPDLGPSVVTPPPPPAPPVAPDTTPPPGGDASGSP
jgi:hypothetical protein